MDQNAQSHRAFGDDEVVCNVHHIQKKWMKLLWGHLG